MSRTALCRGLICALVGGLLVAPGFGQERTRARPAKSAPVKKEKDSKGADSEKEAGKAKARLTPKQINFVKKELIPASQAGDPLALLARLSPHVARLSEPHREAMDALLTEEGAPSIGRMLATARLELFRAKSESAAPELSLAEAVLILADVKAQIDERLNKAKKASYMSDPLPKPGTLLGYRDLLFEVHVQKNELINARELVEFGKTIAIALPESKSKSATDEQREILATSFRKFDGEIRELERDMDERSLELRLDRLDLAIDVLSADSGLKEKFFAAYAVGIDGEFLLAGFKAGGNSFRRPALQNQNLAQELEAKVEKGKLLAGDLLEKARALFVGLHWWRRGRYGRGPEGMGLLKSVAAATSLEASVPLFMPVKSPVPIDPAKAQGQPVPDYDRRHHYAWAWEDRQFQLNVTGTQVGPTSSQEIGRQSMGDYYFY